MNISGIFARIFKRGYRPTPGDGTALNWCSGDLAVCVSPGPWTEYETGNPTRSPPEEGAVFRVRGVGMNDGHQILFFDGRHGEAFTARSFRKAVIGAQEACEPEFVTLLKRSKRKAPA